MLTGKSLGDRAMQQRAFVAVSILTILPVLAWHFGFVPLGSVLWFIVVLVPVIIVMMVFMSTPTIDPWRRWEGNISTVVIVALLVPLLLGFVAAFTSRFLVLAILIGIGIVFPVIRIIHTHRHRDWYQLLIQPEGIADRFAHRPWKRRLWNRFSRSSLTASRRGNKWKVMISPSIWRAPFDCGLGIQIECSKREAALIRRRIRNYIAQAHNPVPARS